MKPRILLPLLSCLALSARAANFTEDFETRPNATFQWTAGNALTSGFASWNFTGGTALVLTEQSVSGDQSLRFAAAPTGPSYITQPVVLSSGGGGVRFLDVALRLPVAKTLTPTETPAWPLGEAQLVLDTLPAMIGRTGTSPTAQLYLYKDLGSGSFSWTPNGPALELEDNGLSLKKWLRLTVRTDAAAPLVDLWMDKKLTVINHPPAPATAGQFLLRAGPSQTSWIEDYTTGDVHPLYTDSDRDAMPDLYEYDNGLNASVNDRAANADGDSLDNISEYWLGTRVGSTDTDGDGMSDSWEYQFNLNPLSNADRNLDLDLDGYTNFEEFTAQTDPSNVAANAGSVVYVKAGFTGAQLGTFTAPFTTIQSALTAVPAGGRVVLLGSGGVFTGTGNVSLAVDKPVTVVGRENASMAGGPGFGFYTTFPPSSGPFVVEDISFSSFKGGADGSAIYSDQVPLTVRRCRFYDCWAADDGGAVFVNGAAFTAEDCTFQLCGAWDKGGALYAEYCPVQVRRCRFLGCYVNTGLGFALHLRQTSGVVENSVASACYNPQNGTGSSTVACVENTTTAFRFCSILNTKASYNYLYAAGMYSDNTTGAITLDSCILWNNKYSNIKSQINGPAFTATYCTIDSEPRPGVGNNTSDPNFFSGTWQLRLSSSSYSALSTSTSNPPALDLDGTPRSSPLERGCSEFDDADGDGLPTTWEQKYFFDPADKSDANLDTDQDGYTNTEEYARQSDPRVATNYDTSVSIFVDPVSGVDTAGTASTVGTFAAPVASISKALTLLYVSGGRTRICLRNGTYADSTTTSLNRNLIFTPPATGSTGFLIKSINGPDAVFIDLKSQGRFLQVNNSSLQLRHYFRGLTIRNGSVFGANGGAILLKNGQSWLDMKDCRFIGCRAVSGGAIYNEATAQSNYSPSNIWIGDSEFTGCEATTSGGAISTVPGSRILLSSNRFSYNAASYGQGGAVFSNGADKGMAISGCVFYRNTAAEGGALAIANQTGLSITDQLDNWVVGSTFKENVAINATPNAASHGGALLITGSNTDIHRSIFDSNSVGASGAGSASGGAIYFAGGNPSIFGSTFSANEAANQGGALRIALGNPVIANCAFKDNLSATEGGAASVKDIVTPNPAPAPVLAHCTLVYNRAPDGAAMYCRSNSSLYNSLSWFNIHNNTASLKTASASVSHKARNGNVATLTLGSGAALFVTGKAVTITEVDSTFNGTWIVSDKTSTTISYVSSGSNVPTTALSSSGSAAITLTREGNNLSSLPSGNTSNISVQPTLAFDNIHLAAPLPPANPNLLGTAQPAYLIYTSETYPTNWTPTTNDFDLELRTSTALDAGCDEWTDSDNDDLPDWFENYIIKYSNSDTLTSHSDIYPSRVLWGSQWNLGQMFVLGADPMLPDAGQRDSDGDELNDPMEVFLTTERFHYDSDADGMPDGWEHRYGLNPKSNVDSIAPNDDPDGDGLKNLEEARHGSNPNDPDTDGDGRTDKQEADNGSDPKTYDSPVPPGEMRYVKFKVGDPSLSRSEKYLLSVVGLGASSYTFYNTETQVQEVECKIRTGYVYQIGLTHMVTTLWIYPDYDYRLEIESDSTWTGGLLDPPSISYRPGTNWRDGPNPSDEAFIVKLNRTNVSPFGPGALWVASNEAHVLGTHWQPGKTNDKYEIDKKHAWLLPAAMITPNGNPVDAPVDAGLTYPAPDGANEFTFNTASTGVLTLTLKARVHHLAQLPAADRAKFRFEVDTIPGSVFTWDAANPGGQPVISGEFLSAKAIYTGLPVTNAAFGSKNARIKYEGILADDGDFEVFFPRDATNHPGGEQGSPNWYYYWSSLMSGYNLHYGGVSQFSDAEVTAATLWNYSTLFNKTLISIYKGSCRKGKSYNVGKEFSGIDYFFSVVLHESKHVDQIDRADKLVTTGVAGSCWQFGWSWKQQQHNHWKEGIDAKWGVAGVDDDANGIVDDAKSSPPFEPGAGTNADESLEHASIIDWPKAWLLPDPDNGGHPLESEAINYSDSMHNEHQNARQDWGNPGKNHKVLNDWDDR